MNQLKRIAGTGFALLTVLCVVTIGVAACSNPSGNDDVAVTGVSLDTTTLSVGVDRMEPLSAVIAPANATNKTVNWASSDTVIATVSAAGVVRGVAEGTATITVSTADGGKTASCTVTVFPSARTSNLSGISVPFRYVPAGSFQRDSTATNVSVITNGYWMSETEVTQELFHAVMNAKPSGFTANPEDVSGDGWKKLPVEKVNWYDAIAFCNKLSLANGKDPVYSVSGVTDWAGLAYGAIPITDNATWNDAIWDKNKSGYRLPTEMEWMWAAMGADKTIQPNTTGYAKDFAGSTGSNSIGDYAWYTTNSGSKTHEVGKKTANELGLKDMSGNVWEWCWDRFGSYPTGGTTNYDGAASGAYRVKPGGSWAYVASVCAVSVRANSIPNNRISDDLGFRVVCR